MKSKRTKQAPKKVKRTKQTPIPASKLLRAESARLDVLQHAMPSAAKDMLSAQVWAYNLAAAFLDALGAPEKVTRYIPATKQP